jgi:hypothetical protein
MLRYSLHLHVVLCLEVLTVRCGSAGTQEPSPEFLQQLREYSGFRMQRGVAKAFKSF